jgi:hypothetical protein
MSYSLDTSALLDAWVRYYPPDVFGTLWKKFETLIEEGRFLVIDEVLREIKRKDDDVSKWVKTRSGMIVPLQASIQTRATQIINQFPSLTQSGGMMQGAADPFVIALAVERDLMVVTGEHSKPSKPRIPDACKTLGIKCGSMVDLFRAEGWNV